MTDLDNAIKHCLEEYNRLKYSTDASMEVGIDTEICGPDSAIESIESLGILVLLEKILSERGIFDDDLFSMIESSQSFKTLRDLRNILDIRLNK